MQTTAANHVSRAGAAEARAGSDVWADFADELAQLATLARTATGPAEFYPELLRRTVAALAAEGGAVWTPGADAAMRQVCLIDSGQRPAGDAERQAHDQLLARVAAAREPRVFAPRSTNGASPGNPLPTVLVVAPVLAPHGDPHAPPAAIIELDLAPGASPSAYKGAEQFAAAVDPADFDHEAEERLAGLVRAAGHDNVLRRFDDPARENTVGIRTAHNLEVRLQFDLFDNRFGKLLAHVAAKGRRLEDRHVDRLNVGGVERTGPDLVAGTAGHQC